MEQEGRARAAGLRGTLAEYVAAVHAAYVDTIRARDAELTDLPLTDEPFSVAVLAGSDLHIVATRDELPPLRPHEEPVDAEAHVEGAGAVLRWRVRFLDASVLPALGAPDVDPLEAAGLAGVLYHLIVTSAGSIDVHQARHAGTGLAHAHLDRRPRG
jgi:hypothetical protein